MKKSTHRLSNLPESFEALVQEFFDMKAEIEELKPLVSAVKPSKENLRILADKQRKILKDRETYNNSPEREYDVAFRYGDGRQSHRRDLPRDISIGFNKIEGLRNRGKIIEMGERLLHEYYRREIKRYLRNERQMELDLSERRSRAGR